MLGIAAITANNGWAMAITGAGIVMTGLALLSFVISQLHKIVAFFDKKEKSEQAAITPAPKKASIEKTQENVTDLLDDLPAAARIYSALAVELGETFSLVALYRVFEKETIPHPHITIAAFRTAGLLVRKEDNSFSWNLIEA